MSYGPEKLTLSRSSTWAMFFFGGGNSKLILTHTHVIKINVIHDIYLKKRPPAGACIWTGSCLRTWILYCLLMFFTSFCIVILALEHSRWDLWGHCYVPVRSWVRSSTFRVWGQNRPIKLLHAKSLLFISTCEDVSYGSSKRLNKDFYVQNHSFPSPRSSTWAMGL